MKYSQCAIFSIDDLTSHSVVYMTSFYVRDHLNVLFYVKRNLVFRRSLGLECKPNVWV